MVNVILTKHGILTFINFFFFEFVALSISVLKMKSLKWVFYWFCHTTCQRQKCSWSEEIVSKLKGKTLLNNNNNNNNKNLFNIPFQNGS